MSIHRDAVETLVDLGVRNRWYPIAASWMISDKQVANAGSTRIAESLFKRFNGTL